jgi:CRISPR/Cas system-associated exonuclease Cas4 (RecB family)
MKKREEFSPSALHLYDSICHKRYWFEYLDPYSSHWENKRRLKQIQVEAGKRKDLIFGGLLHDVLNDFLHLPEDKRTEEDLLNTLKTQWGGPRGKEGGFPNIEEEREFYAKAVKMLKNFASEQELHPKTAYLPTGKIKKDLLKVPIEDGITLMGVIDRIDKEDGSYHLIDYKTGKEKDDDFQLMAYSILSEKALGMPLKKASFLYLTSGKVATYKPTKKAVEDALTKIKNIAGQIKEDKEFDPQPSKMCYYCDFVELCPDKEEARKFIADFKGEKDDLPF